MSWELFERGQRPGSARIWVNRQPGRGRVTRVIFNWRALEIAGLTVGERCSWLVDQDRRIVAIAPGTSEGWKISAATGGGSVSAAIPRSVLGAVPSGSYPAVRYSHEGSVAVGFEVAQ